MISASTMTTPAGPLTVLTEDDVVVAAGFTDDPDRLYRRLPDTGGYARTDDLGDVTKALLRWLDGDLAALDEVQVRQAGTPYQQAIWGALSQVPAGETVSYGTLAERAGAPTAARAAGSACGRNLVAPFVPCHRAVQSGGGLGGYEYGLTVKRWLLAHERGNSFVAVR
ncbi:MAG: methylated-DNA-[protein]-cysteine S-methyltransferase [Frankiales bacterium]|jgi:methylated-DNA-[protein]-cysteine S-methyltransferase|nr:methylated-DNA-[protein]-cysteine S-methyltransferase [Frankiales bacterium]